jgi:hypothetical protein
MCKRAQAVRKSVTAAFSLAIVLGGAVLATPAQASNPDLIVNGSFEQPYMWGGWDVFSSISGWTTISGAGMEIGHFSHYGGITGFGGVQVCELDSYSNSGMRQTIATQAGRSYVLQFRSAKRGGTLDSSNQLNVSWNGAPLVTINPTWTAMQTHSYTVVATGASADLDFVAGGTSDSLGSMVDVVSLALKPADVCLLYDPAKLHKSGSTIPVKLQLCDGASNISAAGIVLHATGVQKVGDVGSGTPEDSGNANPDSDFRYDATLGDTGGYIFNLSTKGLVSGTYLLNFTVEGDSTNYSIEFRIK